MVELGAEKTILKEYFMEFLLLCPCFLPLVIITLILGEIGIQKGRKGK